MTIAEAKEKLAEIQTWNKDDSTNHRINILMQDINHLFVDADELNDARIVNIINNADSRLKSGQIDYIWVMNLNAAFVAMKRRLQCKEWLNVRRKKIDGETAQWITNIAQSVLGICSAVFTVLFALGIIPNIFGDLGDKSNSDALYYILGIVVQQLVAFVFAVVIGVINHCRKKKLYKNSEFSFEELLACKYADKPKTLWLLSPMVKKIKNVQLAIGDNNRQSQGNKARASDNAKNYQNPGDVTEGISEETLKQILQKNS